GTDQLPVPARRCGGGFGGFYRQQQRRAVERQGQGRGHRARDLHRHQRRTGRAAAQCLAVLTAPDGMVTAPITQPPCEVSTGDTPDRYLIIYGTGWRNGATGAVTVQVQKDTDTPVTLATNYVGAQPTFALAGLDQINAILPKDLAKGTLKLTVLGPGTIKSQDNVTIEIK